MAETDQSSSLIAPEPIFNCMLVQGGGGEIGFGPFKIHSPKIKEPIHEQMTIAALINSNYKLDSRLTFHTLRDDPNFRADLNDFVRGVLWNDDPECLLFDEDSSNNLTYSTGAMWARKFKFGSFDKSQLIRRSHFGNLQWLHAMGSREREPLAETKSLILRWMETMYNLAIGTLDPNTQLKETWLNDWFEDPDNYTSVGGLLTHRHKSAANVQHRALGSCFHVLQDSYAIGHTRRELLNPGEKLDEHEIRFNPGTVDRWGALLNFHTYVGQSDEHAHYDHSKANVANLDLANLDAWNGLVGCRDGVDACVRLANFWYEKAPWKDVYTWLEGDVFKLSEDAKPSNNTVT